MGFENNRGSHMVEYARSSRPRACAGIFVSPRVSAARTERRTARCTDAGHQAACDEPAAVQCHILGHHRRRPGPTPDRHRPGPNRTGNLDRNIYDHRTLASGEVLSASPTTGSIARRRRSDLRAILQTDSEPQAFGLERKSALHPHPLVVGRTFRASPWCRRSSARCTRTRSDWPHIHVPTLAFGGAEDLLLGPAAVPGAHAGVGRHVPNGNGRALLFPGLGHAPSGRTSSCS